MDAAYDDVGMKTKLRETSAGLYTYSYDQNNRLTQINNTGSVRTSFVYNAAGQRTVLRPGNGTRTSYSYDAAGQTTQILHRKSDSTSLLQLDYRYDTAGNRQVMIEGAGTARVTWIYDNQNQLTGENRTGTNPYRNTFTYDSAGNRTVKNAAGTRTTSSYDSANQLKYSQATAGRTTYTFDAAGNQQIELTPAGARTTTTWNYENQPTAYQLSTGSRVTMSYNADNRRTQKQTAASTSTKFIWEPTTDAYFSELNNANTNQMIYTFEPVQYGNLISQRTGGAWYIHADALGSTRALSTGGNTVSDTFLYDAWGTEVARTGTTAILPFRWVGGVGYYYDTETGLYYVRARVYQPTLAMWMSVDPVFVELLRNQFVYANNAPSFLIDPYGLDAVAENLISLESSFEATPNAWTKKDPLDELEKWLIKLADHRLDDTVISIPAFPKGKCGKKCYDVEAGPCKITVKPGTFAILCVPIAKLHEKRIGKWKGGFKNACRSFDCWFCPCENEIPYDNPVDNTPLSFGYPWLKCNLIVTCPKSVHEYGSNGVCPKLTIFGNEI